MTAVRDVPAPGGPLLRRMVVTGAPNLLASAVLVLVPVVVVVVMLVLVGHRPRLGPHPGAREAEVCEGASTTTLGSTHAPAPAPAT